MREVVFGIYGSKQKISVTIPEVVWNMRLSWSLIKKLAWLKLRLVSGLPIGILKSSLCPIGHDICRPMQVTPIEEISAIIVII